MRKPLFLCVLLCLTGWPAFSQQQFIPLDRDCNLRSEAQLNHKDNFSHTGFRPFLESKINIDSLELADSIHIKPLNYKRWIARKLKSESLLVVHVRDSARTLSGRGPGDFHLAIDPLFHFQFTGDRADTSVRADTTRFITNTRGVLVRADFGSRVSATTSFLENQSYFPKYIDDFVSSRKVVPGSGRTKPFKFSGYDYAMASGYVSYSPFKNLNFQIGHDKNFIGDGYRSILLSDNSFNYPFLKITSSFWKNRIQLTNLYTQLSSLDRIPVSTTPEALFMPKAGTFHYLSLIPWNRMQICFFEGIIWQRWDSLGTKSFDWNFINPVPFCNTAIYGLQGKNNAVAGVNLKFKILKGLALYGQFAFDDDEKYGYQAGLRAFDLFSLKNLNFQAEYNSVMPFAFTHEIPLLNYSHYNQELGHPLGAGFSEMLSIFDYRWNDFFIHLKFNIAGYSEPGKDIFGLDKPEPYYSARLYPPRTENKLFFQEYRIGYLINRQTNMNIFFGYTDRSSETTYTDLAFTVSNRSQLVFFGIRTAMGNKYFDF